MPKVCLSSIWAIANTSLNWRLREPNTVCRTVSIPQQRRVGWGGPAFGADVGALDGLALQFMCQRQPNQVLGHAVRRVAVFAVDVSASVQPVLVLVLVIVVVAVVVVVVVIVVVVLLRGPTSASSSCAGSRGLAAGAAAAAGACPARLRSRGFAALRRRRRVRPADV